MGGLSLHAEKTFSRVAGPKTEPVCRPARRSRGTAAGKASGAAAVAPLTAGGGGGGGGGGSGLRWVTSVGLAPGLNGNWVSAGLCRAHAGWRGRRAGGRRQAAPRRAEPSEGGTRRARPPPALPNPPSSSPPRPPGPLTAGGAASPHGPLPVRVGMGGARPHLGAQTPGERRPLRLFVCAEGGGGGGGGEGRARCAGPGGRGGQKPLCGARGGGHPLRHRQNFGEGGPPSPLSPAAGALPGWRRGRAGRGVPCVLGGGLRGSRRGAAPRGF